MMRNRAFWILLALLVIMPLAVSSAVRDLFVGVVQVLSTLLAHMPHQHTQPG